MAELAIRGHATRGQEVIEILKMLGGIGGNYKADFTSLLFFIGKYNYITYDDIENSNDYVVFTLEEFLEKFPYKVGDKAQLDGWPCVITEMSWGYDDVVYSVKGVDFSKRVCSKDLQPYKEEIMEEKLERIKIAIPDGYEFFGIDDDSKIVLTKKQIQYPKTIEECAKVLSTLPHTRNGVSGYSSYALWKVQQLLICRDAYWKIAGDERGLGKPWKPEPRTHSKERYVIITDENDILFTTESWSIYRILLEFPNAEMRDAFYENFKDLIEECKEFL